MKLNFSSCLFFGCECFGTCTCVCKLLILLCCQINVFKSFRAKRGRGHIPLPHPPPFGDPRPHRVHIFFFRTPPPPPPFSDLATGLRSIAYQNRIMHKRRKMRALGSPNDLQPRQLLVELHRPNVMCLARIYHTKKKKKN